MFNLRRQGSSFSPSNNGVVTSVVKIISKSRKASHYVTFDGAKWDITAGCEMILATNRCFKTKNDTSDYFKVRSLIVLVWYMV